MKHLEPELFKLKPQIITAFQWNPDDPEFVFPKWCADLIEIGKIRTVKNTKEAFILIDNKRSPHGGLPGDWVYKDSFQHISVISQSTFRERCYDLNEPVCSNTANTEEPEYDAST